MKLRERQTTTERTIQETGAWMNGTLTIGDPSVRTKEDLFLPNLRALYIPLTMDAADLIKFTHLKKLECLQLGGSSLRAWTSFPP